MGEVHQRSIELLDAVAYTIKMSYKGVRDIDGYLPYVVPPLEGFWWQAGVQGVDYAHKASFQWISVIRLPDFVAESDLEWAKAEAARKKKMDFSPVEFLSVNEGLCVQAMHLGPFDEEPKTVTRMEEFLGEQGYVSDFSDSRMHHEIYLSDVRRVTPDKYRTVIRHPIKKR